MVFKGFPLYIVALNSTITEKIIKALEVEKDVVGKS